MLSVPLVLLSREALRLTLGLKTTPALTFNGFWMALASCPTDLCYLVWYCLSRCVLFYRKHPNQQLKKEFRCQFHTLYHKKVVLLPSGLLVIDQWLTPRPRALAL